MISIHLKTDFLIFDLSDYDSLLKKLTLQGIIPVSYHTVNPWLGRLLLEIDREVWEMNRILKYDALKLKNQNIGGFVCWYRLVW